ncbi:hypothetical protein BGZ46_001145 [Entomortierella lignicola]|nr:hypothetical protein BGZ46_001145 [Entomortierella lignicola]
MDSYSAPSSRNEYWCFQCTTEITPLLVPDPLCPRCYCEFVEKIEEENDPRDFVETIEDDVDDNDVDHEGLENLGMDDLLRIFRIISGSSQLQQQQLQQRSQQRDEAHIHRLPGEFPEDNSVPIMFNPGFRLRSPETLLEARLGRTRRGTIGSITTSSSFSYTDDEGVEMVDVPDEPNYDTSDDEDDDDDDEEYQLEHIHGEDHEEDEEGDSDQNEEQEESEEYDEEERYHPAGFISSLLERLGFEAENDEQSSSGLGGLFNMVRNPGDYVLSQGALDNVISQMMETQSHQDGPVGATDEIINSIPRRSLTTEELNADTECSICKDELYLKVAQDEQLMSHVSFSGGLSK